ncbi:MAG: heterocyst frequency control protein PatD [Coleofasciculus sp. B1-GNL1-01]|uniref:heterocyst frequency control protein PatD n=1 Tax=Coleofasciculus sp. B1-GNL1-01 TaxID=3068484 RepID=UPI0032F6CED0
MLIPSQRQSYQDFQHVLDDLHKSIQKHELDKTEIQERFQAVKQLFQARILTLNPDEVNQEHVSAWQSRQTEIHRQMRLLETDMLMLQAARNSATVQSRVAIICDRLNTLIQYCSAMLQL